MIVYNMKKNNKFRNNGNSNAYSLNYKFDSISPAGKISGTALDLIKKYNELAKEAHGSGDYIEMEVYRQYAEHYRKIVTEINERKNSRQDQPNNAENQSENTQTTESDDAKTAQAEVNENTAVETPSVEPVVQTPMPMKKKTFKIVEIKPASENLSENATAETSTSEKPKRCIRRKKTESADNKPSSEAI